MIAQFVINRIKFSQKAKDGIISEIEKFGDSKETGGVLIGYVEESHIVVEEASGPGPKAVHEKFFFQADAAYINMVIDLRYADSNGRLNYIAEWHTHPETYPEPSPYDLNSISEICTSSGTYSALVIFGATGFEKEKLLQKSFGLIKFNQVEKFYRIEVS